MIHLHPVTPANFAAIVALEPTEAQRSFVATTVLSIAQSKVWPECVPLGLYDDVRLVGFMMYGPDRRAGRWWLHRFLIDRRHQGRGLGRPALAASLERIRGAGRCEAILLSVNPTNGLARRLYAERGFVPEGWQIDGEDVLRLDLGQ